MCGWPGEWDNDVCGFMCALCVRHESEEGCAQMQERWFKERKQAVLKD